MFKICRCTVREKKLSRTYLPKDKTEKYVICETVSLVTEDKVSDPNKWTSDIKIIF